MVYNDKQTHIIKTAERLFSAKGYHGTSVRDIAEEAGVNLAMISYYFGSKDKLMQALFEERTKDITSKIEKLLRNESLSPFEKLDNIVDDYVERITYKQQFYKIMLHEQLIEKNGVVAKAVVYLKKTHKGNTVHFRYRFDDVEFKNHQIQSAPTGEGQKAGGDGQAE